MVNPTRTERVVDPTTGFAVTIGTGRLLSLFDRTPRLAFRHIRDAVGGMFGSHRREWLQRTQVEFSARGGMRAERLNSRQPPAAAGFNSARTFFYKVQPQAKRVAPGVEPRLQDITAETYTQSRVALGLEVGGTFRAKGSRFLAIPIGVTLDSLGRPKSRWATPGSYRKASANNELVSLKLRGKYPVLYQVKGGGSRRAASQQGAFSLLSDRPQGRRSTGRRILLPAYQLVPAVTRRAILRYVATWEDLEQDRARRLTQAADNILADIDSGKQA